MSQLERLQEMCNELWADMQALRQPILWAFRAGDMERYLLFLRLYERLETTLEAHRAVIANIYQHSMRMRAVLYVNSRGQDNGVTAPDDPTS